MRLRIQFAALMAAHDRADPRYPRRAWPGVGLRLDGRLVNLAAVATARTPEFVEGTVKVERVKGIEPSS